MGGWESPLASSIFQGKQASIQKRPRSSSQNKLNPSLHPLRNLELTTPTRTNYLEPYLDHPTQPQALPQTTSLTPRSSHTSPNLNSTRTAHRGHKQWKTLDREVGVAVAPPSLPAGTGTNRKEELCNAMECFGGSSISGVPWRPQLSQLRSRSAKTHRQMHGRSHRRRQPRSVQPRRPELSPQEEMPRQTKSNEFVSAKCQSIPVRSTT